MLAGICALLDVAAGSLVALPVIMAGGGFMALAHSLLFRFQGRPWVFVMMLGFVFVMMIGILASTSQRVMEGSGTFHIRLAIAGVIALALAAIINHHPLTTSTSASPAYQRTPQPFGGATSR